MVISVKSAEFGRPAVACSGTLSPITAILYLGVSDVDTLLKLSKRLTRNLELNLNKFDNFEKLYPWATEISGGIVLLLAQF